MARPKHRLPNGVRIPAAPRDTPRRKTTRRKHKRDRSCGGKRRFRDKAEAQSALRILAQRSTRKVIPWRAYECPGCSGWHLSKEAAR